MLITFYPDTDLIELEIDISGFRNDIYKMEPVSSTEYSYSWHEQRGNQTLYISLKLNRLFGYIRGGTIEMTGKIKEEDEWNEHKDKVLIEFERK